MRVNVDEDAFEDIRMKRLAKRVGSLREALGGCVMVWHECYRALSPVLSREDIDVLAGLDGWADHMIAVGLASDTPDGVFIHGVEERIAPLKALRDGARAGGESRKDANRAGGRFCKPATFHQPSNQPSASPAPAVDPALDHRSASPLLSSLFSLEEEKSPASDDAGRQPSKPRREPKPESAEARELAAYLDEAIRSHSPTAKTKPDGWITAFDLGIRVDGRTVEGFKYLIDYCHRSPKGAFWRANILSGSKLREKFDRIDIEMRQSGAGIGLRVVPPEDGLARKRRLEREADEAAYQARLAARAAEPVADATTGGS